MSEEGWIEVCYMHVQNVTSYSVKIMHANNNTLVRRRFCKPGEAIKH